MEFYLSANNSLKGRKILFKYPNLMTVKNLQNDIKFKLFLETKDLFQKTKIVKKKNYRNYKFLESVYGIDYKEKTEKFLNSNLILKKIINNNKNLSAKEIIKKYYEETELYGMIEKKNCLNISSNYFISLIHKINKPGFFKFNIENKIIFGYKKNIIEKNFEIVSIFENEENFKGCGSKENLNDKINFFFIFMILDSDKSDKFFIYKKSLNFLQNILFKLETNFSMISNNYFSNFEKNYKIYPEIIYYEKEKKIIQNIFLNYLKTTKNEDLMNFLSQVLVSIINGYELKIKNLKIDFKQFFTFNKNKLELENQLKKNHFYDFENKTLLFYNKKNTLSKINDNEILITIIKEISPFESFYDIYNKLHIKKKEFKFYIKHLIFWNECKLVYPILNSSILIPNYDNKNFHNILNKKKKEFFFIFKKSITDVIFFFLKNKSISFFNFKKEFLTDTVKPRNIVIFLLTNDLVISKRTEIICNRKNSMIIKQSFCSQKNVIFSNTNMNKL